MVQPYRPMTGYNLRSAKVAELADAPDLGSGTARCGGSSPPFRTINKPTAQRSCRAYLTSNRWDHESKGRADEKSMCVIGCVAGRLEPVCAITVRSAGARD